MKTEKKPTHTPGPWEWRETLSGNRLYIMGLEKPETKVCELSFPGTDEGRNTARLIAAAPDLLRMLKLAVMCEIRMPKNWDINGDGEPTTDENASDAVARLYNDMLAAIAKAGPLASL